MNIIIELTREDIPRKSKNISFEKIIPYDFNLNLGVKDLMMQEKADFIIFKDDDGRTKILKQRNTEMSVSCIHPGYPENACFLQYVITYSLNKLDSTNRFTCAVDVLVKGSWSAEMKRAQLYRQIAQMHNTEMRIATLDDIHPNDIVILCSTRL